MNFINGIMKELWKGDAILFQTAYQEACENTAYSLYQKLRDKQIQSFGQDYQHLNILPTCGCSHHIRNINDMSGCSMCNLHTDYKQVANLKALRDKDALLYAQVIYDNFISTRSLITKRTLAEQIITHNFFDDYEIPEEVLDKLFGASGVFQKKPVILELETNVNSISQEKLKKFRTYNNSSQLWFRIGIECENEWLRNNWLNKNTSNRQIAETIRLLKSEGYKITANILLGLPGITEEQMIQQFIQTITWINNDIDMYNISVLNLRENTLQWLLNKKLGNNTVLERRGIAQGEHTGLPWLFTLLHAIRWALTNVDGFERKLLAIGQFFSPEFTEYYELPYNAKKDCQCTDEIYDYLKKRVVDKDWRTIIQLESGMKDHSCLNAYKQLVEKQKSAGTLKETLQMVGEEVAKSLWHENYQRKIEFFYKELSYLTI